MANITFLDNQARLIRHHILTSSTTAGSGHPTSSLSAVELMVTLFFGSDDTGASFFRFDLGHTDHPNNDRLLLSKGHATPLFYALWAAAGAIPFSEMKALRAFSSPLEGHPTPHFRYTEAATGSLGQGLAIGLGMALNGRYLDRLPYRTFVLLGDSEMTEGSQWEALQLACHYRLGNLIGIMDVNRLGQRGETMYGHDIEAYRQRIASFGWRTVLVQDGHDLDETNRAFVRALDTPDIPTMIIARTIKGKGIQLLADKEGWHGKTLSETQCRQALAEIGAVDAEPHGQLAMPETRQPFRPAAPHHGSRSAYNIGDQVATRNAYGAALAELGAKMPEVVVLDAEVSNSTKSETFAEAFPDRYFEMFVAEQNMIGTALGLDLLGKVVFASTFAAFLMRACDQIRMARYSDSTINICGSHAGVSIGEDGPSQMGLEDLAFFRTILDCAVLNPADAVATEKLVFAAARHDAMTYLRTTRSKTPVLYDSEESFPIGGSKVLRRSAADRVTIVGAGITLHQALAAADLLAAESVMVRLIDLYSVKPVDRKTLLTAARETGCIVTVEDHFAEGGIGEAVASALADSACPVHLLAVTRKPRSGTPEELLDYEGISTRAIVDSVRRLL